MWFACPPGYYAHPTRGEAREQLASLQAFSQLLSSFLKGAWPTFKPAPATAGAGPAAVHPVWGEGAPDVPGCVKLLQVRCGAIDPVFRSVIAVSGVTSRAG